MVCCRISFQYTKYTQTVIVSATFSVFKDINVTCVGPAGLEHIVSHLIYFQKKKLCYH